MQVAPVHLTTRMASKRPRRQNHRVGRVWLRPTEAEWDAILATAHASGMTHSEWCASVLLEEARREAAVGHTSAKLMYRRNRVVLGERLSDERKNPKKNIYMSAEEAELIKSVANFRGLSTNAWGMLVLNRAVDQAEWEQVRRQNLALDANQDRLTPQMVAEIKRGKIPSWLREAMELAQKSKKKRD